MSFMALLFAFVFGFCGAYLMKWAVEDYNRRAPRSHWVVEAVCSVLLLFMAIMFFRVFITGAGT